eukprot:2402268-Rhodomonas_salina.4
MESLSGSMKSSALAMLMKTWSEYPRSVPGSAELVVCWYGAAVRSAGSTGQSAARRGVGTGHLVGSA